MHESQKLVKFVVTNFNHQYHKIRRSQIREKNISTLNFPGFLSFFFVDNSLSSLCPPNINIESFSSFFNVLNQNFEFRTSTSVKMASVVLFSFKVVANFVLEEMNLLQCLDRFRQNIKLQGRSKFLRQFDYITSLCIAIVQLLQNVHFIDLVFSFTRFFVNRRKFLAAGLKVIAKLSLALIMSIRTLGICEYG